MNPNSNIKSETSPKPSNQQTRGKPYYPYNDLREVINKKRNQHRNDGSGPPPDPRYNFLSDPTRDNDYDPSKEEKVTFEHRNSRGRFPNRSRGRSSNRGNYSYQQGRIRDEAGLLEEGSAENHEWTREWDAGKEVPFRPNSSPHRHPRPSYSNHGIRRPESHHQPNHDTFEPVRSERNFYPRSPRSHRPPQNFRGTRNYNRRGAGSKPINPVNITIAYTVGTGERKCTIEEIPKMKSKEIDAKKNQNLEKSGGEFDVSCEENWDTETENWDNSTPTKEVEDKDNAEQKCTSEKFSKIKLKETDAKRNQSFEKSREELGVSCAENWDNSTLTKDKEDEDYGEETEYEVEKQTEGNKNKGSNNETEKANVIKNNEHKQETN